MFDVRFPFLKERENTWPQKGTNIKRTKETRTYETLFFVTRKHLRLLEF